MCIFPLACCLLLLGCSTSDRITAVYSAGMSKLAQDRKYSESEYRKYYRVPQEKPELRVSNSTSSIQLYDSGKIIGTSCKVLDGSNLLISDRNGKDFEIVGVAFQNLNQALDTEGEVLMEHSLRYKYGRNVIDKLNVLGAPLAFSNVQAILRSAELEEYELVETGEITCSEHLSRTAWVTELTVRDTQGQDIVLQVYKEFYMVETECP